MTPSKTWNRKSVAPSVLVRYPRSRVKAWKDEKLKVKTPSKNTLADEVKLRAKVPPNSMEVREHPNLREEREK